MIYFVRCAEFDAIKIGFTSTSPTSRLADLQCGNPFLLHVVVVVPGGREREREFHIRFQRLRIRGEWFRYDAELKDWLKGMQQEWQDDWECFWSKLGYTVSGKKAAKKEENARYRWRLSWISLWESLGRWVANTHTLAPTVFSQQATPDATRARSLPF